MSFAILATVAFAIVFAFAFSANSFNLAGRIEMFYLHPSNVNVVVTTMMFSTLPTLLLANVLLSVSAHLAKLLVIVTWIISLFVFEEIFFIELLHPDLFVAMLVLCAMHLLAFLRMPLVIKIAFLLIGRIVLICLRTFRIAFGLIVKIMFLRMIYNSNLPTFGLVVYVGSCFAVLSYGIGRKLLQLTLRVFDVITDAIASAIIHLPRAPAADEAAASDVIELLQRASKEEMPVVVRPPQCVVGLPENVVVAHPKPAKAIRWSDAPFVDTRFRPYYHAGHTISSRLYTCNKSDRRRLEKHAATFGCVMDELVGLASDVYFVPLREEGRCDWSAIRAVVDDNYTLHWNAQGAFRDLVSVYNRLQREHPRRFRSRSDYEKRLTECKLFEQGIDMLFLEMKLLADFEPSPVLRIVRKTWEDAAYDDAEENQEAAAEPLREDADARPRIEVEVNAAPAEVVAVEEPINFDPMDVAEEDEEETPPNLRRRRRRSEAARLNSDLGKYWVCHPRMSGRMRRQPVRYEP